MQPCYPNSRVVRVHLANPYFIAEACALKFILTYEGPLKTGGDGGKALHKIRLCFHRQLKRLWQVNRLLANWHIDGVKASEKSRLEVGTIGGFEFVPLVTKSMAVECAVDFTILRSTLKYGELSDIDNQIGILFDALKKPQDVSQLGTAISPADDNNPLYVLIQDDKLISKVSSTSDELLLPVQGKDAIEPNDVRVLVSIYLRPFLPKSDNLIFFSEDREVWDHKYDEAIPENLSALTNSQLRAITTQCIFRIRAMAEAFNSWGDAAAFDNFSANARLATSDEAAKDAALWTSMAKRTADNTTMWNMWRSGLQPKAFALKSVLQSRVYGEGPYPSDLKSIAIESGMLAGHAPLMEAANVLDQLVRILS